MEGGSLQNGLWASRGLTTASSSNLEMLTLGVDSQSAKAGGMGPTRQLGREPLDFDSQKATVRQSSKKACGFIPGSSYYIIDITFYVVESTQFRSWEQALGKYPGKTV